MVMDEDAVENATIALVIDNAGDTEAVLDSVNLHEVVAPDAEGMQEVGSASEILTRVELDLAYCSEKLVNLDILLMHVAVRESSVEALAVVSDDISAESIENALEFNLLSGILDSEVKELDNFMASLQVEIVNTRQKISSCQHLRDIFVDMEVKLQDSEESLKRSQEQVSELKMQSSKFQRTLLDSDELANRNNNRGAEFSDSDQSLDMDAKLKMQTAEQRTHILRMLEKSLARELDLEKKLSETRQSEEELKLKLHSDEHDIFCMEEAAEVLLGRLFETENAAEVLMGISKELMGRLQIVQFNQNGLIRREDGMRSKLQDCMEQLKAKETAFQKLETSTAELDKFLMTQITNLKALLKAAEDRYILANSESFTLRDKVHSLEEQLKESELQLQNSKESMEASQEPRNALCSQLSEMENVIEDLKENISRAESMAESMEAKCVLLTETNLELNEELGVLKSSGNNMEKVNFLEKQLRESDIQLQIAKASAEASQEQQNMLYSATEDMENLIDDLKSKVLKAESRAESAEAKCVLLSETNLELNEELSFLRGRMECLETSLHQADDTKIATAKDINIRTKAIADLVMQLAMERERLQMQIYSLTKENKIFMKLCKAKDDTSETMNFSGNEKEKDFSFSKDDLPTATCMKASEEAVTSISFQVAPAGEPEISVEDDVAGPSKIETVRTIEAGQLSAKYVFVAILVLLISMVAVYLFQQES